MAETIVNPVTIDELESLARQKLPKNVYDYYASGADDQKCLIRNRVAFDRLVRLHAIQTSMDLYLLKHPHPAESDG